MGQQVPQVPVLGKLLDDLVGFVLWPTCPYYGLHPRDLRLKPMVFTPSLLASEIV